MSPKIALQALCFDLFHTLVDVGRVPAAVGAYTADILGLKREAWNDACFSEHHPITRQSEHEEVIRCLAHSLNPEIDNERIQTAVAHRQRRFDHALTEVDGETLSALEAIRRQGLPMALISNASTAEVSAWSNSPLREFFDVALFSCELGLKKPDPAIYRRAARDLGVDPGQCLFIGDGGSDEHRGARASGMHPVLINHYINEQKRQARRPHCYWEVQTLGQIPGLLQKITAA